MGHGRHGNLLTYIWLGLVVFLAFTTHSGSAWETAKLKLTLPNYDDSYRLTYTISFFKETAFDRLVDCLCNSSRSTCSLSFKGKNELADRVSLPATISGDLDYLSTWSITFSEIYEPHLIHHIELTRRNSADSKLKCWDRQECQILAETSECSSKPQRVYLGHYLWLEINDRAEVFYLHDDDEVVCEHGNLGCAGDYVKTPTPPIVVTTENVHNEGNDDDFLVDNHVEDNQESSRDQTPVIIGGVITVIIVVILLTILARILWRRWKSKPREANSTFAASNPGAYAGRNARNGAVQNWGQQSVSTVGLPPPYHQGVRAQNANTEHGFANNTYFALYEDDLH